MYYQVWQSVTGYLCYEFETIAIEYPKALQHS